MSGGIRRFKLGSSCEPKSTSLFSPALNVIGLTSQLLFSQLLCENSTKKIMKTRNATTDSAYRTTQRAEWSRNESAAVKADPDSLAYCPHLHPLQGVANGI
jgi:hypothetical protein